MTSSPGRTAGRVVRLAVLGIAAYYAVWGGEYSLFDLGRLREAQRVEEARLTETRSAVDSLNQLITRLEDDPATIEAVARERFGMIRDGETIYRIVELDAEAPDPGTP